MQIVMLDQNTYQRDDEYFDYSSFQELGTFIVYKDSDQSQIVKRCKDAGAIIINNSILTSEIIQQLLHTKLILKAGIGVDNIDLDAAKQCKIHVCNFPRYNTELIAQWTFGFIFACANSLNQYNIAFKKGHWQQSLYQYPIQEVAGKYLGIVGFGNAGKRVAELAHVFNMKILIHSVYPNNDKSYEFVDLNTLAETANFITLHRQLAKPYIGLINSAFLKKMRKDAYLINTARAALVDETAIITALQQNQIAGFASDVFWQEPTPKDHPLYHLDNVLLTPHIAWGAPETRQRLLNQMAATIRCYLNGQSFHSII